MNFKNLISKNKKIVICLIVALVIGVLCGSSEMPKKDYNNLIAQKQEQDNQILALDEKLEKTSKEVDDLQDEKDKADEKQRIEEQKAKEKAEAEACAKREAEKAAKEEAERVAREEAEKAAKAEAERIASEQQNSNNYVDSSSNTNNVQQQTPQTQMVWLSETGSKYHSINNCGRMNPSKARQVTLESAIAQNMQPCSKCW